MQPESLHLEGVLGVEQLLGLLLQEASFGGRLGIPVGLQLGEDLLLLELERLPLEIQAAAELHLFEAQLLAECHLDLLVAGDDVGVVRALHPQRVAVEERGREGQVQLGVARHDVLRRAEELPRAQLVRVVQDAPGALQGALQLQHRRGRAAVGLQLAQEHRVGRGVGDVGAEVGDRGGGAALAEVVVDPAEDGGLGGQVGEGLRGLAGLDEAGDLGVLDDVDLGEQGVADELPDDGEHEVQLVVGEEVLGGDVDDAQAQLREAAEEQLVVDERLELVARRLRHLGEVHGVGLGAVQQQAEQVAVARRGEEGVGAGEVDGVLRGELREVAAQLLAEVDRERFDLAGVDGVHAAGLGLELGQGLLRYLLR